MVRVWTPETNVLEKDLVADTTKSDGWASIIRDDLHNTYQAMGYDSDTSVNYTLHPVDGFGDRRKEAQTREVTGPGFGGDLSSRYSTTSHKPISKPEGDTQ